MFNRSHGSKNSPVQSELDWGKENAMAKKLKKSIRLNLLQLIEFLLVELVLLGFFLIGCYQAYRRFLWFLGPYDTNPKAWNLLAVLSVMLVILAISLAIKFYLYCEDELFKDVGLR